MYHYMDERLFPLPEKKVDNEVKPAPGVVRVQKPDRLQVQMQIAALDDLIPDDHPVRMVWEIVEAYDLERFYRRIKAVEGEAGRPAIDPRLLIAVWLYATLKGIVSARELARLCDEHVAFRWIMGGVSVNYHTLADFRVTYEEELDDLLTKSVAALMSEGIVKLERTAQDGVRIRASAGASSFRRKPTLKDCLRDAKDAIEQQKKEGESAHREGERLRRKAAQERHRRERFERIQKALEEADQVAERRQKNRESRRKGKPARASTTDPEARVMKMPDGGFRPAYNGQFCIDMDSRIIVGVDVSNQADTKLLQPMVEKIETSYGKRVNEHYVDGGFRSKRVIEELEMKGVQLYCPIPASYNTKSKHAPEEILPRDGPGVRAWKHRMVTEEAKEKYQERASTAEWANALARNRGLQRFLVRGMKKTRAVLLWYALAHNLIQAVNLRAAAKMQAS